jgi:pimeloyl-ACP methyl ester carboxylesterase
MKLGPEVFIAQSIALAERPDSGTTLDTIRCPTLVLCGAEDSLCPPALHRSMAGRIAGAALQIVPDCGHLPTLEQPEAVNDALRRWLAAA